MELMPLLFIGHGSPMNIIEENPYIHEWKNIALKIPRPQAILCISAHWYKAGNFLSLTKNPQTIHDFYGFPPVLYELVYPARGAVDLAQSTFELLDKKAAFDLRRGFDHGVWSVLHFMYPEADVPVCQLSVNSSSSTLESYHLGRQIASLRQDGVLILGSGNVVHNLQLINPHQSGGYDWADAFDLYIRDAIVNNKHDQVINYLSAGNHADYAFTSRDHFDPLLYILGASHALDSVRVFNEARVMGALSMTSYLFEQ